MFLVDAEDRGRPTPSTCIHQTPRQTLDTHCHARASPQPQTVTLALVHRRGCRWADSPKIGAGGWGVAPPVLGAKRTSHGVVGTRPHPPRSAPSSVHWVTEATAVQRVALVCDV